MKKKLFATLALFASLTLAACGGSTNSGVTPTPGASSNAGDSTKQNVSSDGGASAKSNPVSDKTSDAGASTSKSSKHTHTAKEDAPWVSDESRHWQECEAGDGGKVNSKAHTFEEKTDDPANKPATCKETGVKVEVCSVCGYRKESETPKLDHTWNDGVASGNCGEAGKVTYTCTECGETKEEVTGYIQHSWEVTGNVEAGDGGLAYNLVKCTKCQKEGLMVATRNADGTDNMTITGSPKTAPEGCVKLGANGDSMTAVIKLAEAKTGKLFIRGSMDYWYTDNNQNEQKGIFNGKSGGGADKANNKANFKMEVGADADHLEEVTITSSQDLLYKDYLPEEPGFTNVADTDWSQIGDIEVGNVSLSAGLNTIKFTRTDSYNIAVHDFVVAFDNVA